MSNPYERSGPPTARPAAPATRRRRAQEPARPVPSRAAAEPPESIDSGRRRVILEHVRPEIDGGRFPVKRTVGETVPVIVDMFADGHDLLAGVVKFRHVVRAGDSTAGRADRPRLDWLEVPLSPIDNDAWGASFVVTELGRYEYTVEGWINRFGTWLKGLVAKADAGQDVASELLEGAEIVRAAGLADRADVLAGSQSQAARVAAARDAELRRLMDERPDRQMSSAYDRVLRVIVDPVLARFGAWYEMFPRSCTPDPSRSGTFREAEARLPDIAAMGFDVLYLPPIHPIGRALSQGAQQRADRRRRRRRQPVGDRRRGRRPHRDRAGARHARRTSTGSSTRPRALGLEIALDIAFQARPITRGCASTRSGSSTAPTARSSTPRTRRRSIRTSTRSTSRAPTGSRLWEELRDVFLFWVAHGVTHLPRRQPAHQAVPRSGSGASPRSSGSTRTRSSWPRRSPARR